MADNGRGISEQDIPRAFQRFEDVGVTSGSGLGGSIVDAVARSYGGPLDLRPAHPGPIAILSLAVQRDQPASVSVGMFHELSTGQSQRKRRIA